MQLATPRQLQFLNSLKSQKPVWAASRAVTPDSIMELSIREASDLITEALNAPSEQQNKPRLGALALEQIEPGSYWTLDGGVARVRRSQRTQRVYAERLNEHSGKFEYARSQIFGLRARMTLDEAKAWGARFHRCCVCGALLTDNNSVDAGIGPVCAKKV